MSAATKDARNVPVQLQPENVPLALRGEKRWVVWLPKWADGKFGKKPGRIDMPGVGLTNWANEGWVDFDTAVAAWRANPQIFGGVGYVMTNSQRVTGVDLDHCIDAAGAIAPWAQEIIRGLGTYTEVSPSGTGIRAFITGNLDDWQTPRNGEVNIEVYGGSAGRFLTVTGARIPGAAMEVKEADSEVLADMKARYKMVPKSTDNVEDLHLPDIIPECLLNDASDLMLPPHAKNFLTDGPTKRDRSGQLFNTAIALSQAGETREEIYSRLAQNEHALSLAEDHWKGHAEKALRYLWKHSAQKGESRANDFKQDRLNDFEDYEEDSRERTEEEVASAKVALEGGAAPIDDFESLPALAGEDNRHVDLAPIKAPRFTPLTPSQFLKRKPGSWIVKGIVPRAGLAVIYGASGSGKTFLTLDMVGAVVRGAPWRGAISHKGRAVYVVAEGASGFRNRLEAYCEFHGVEPDDFEIGVVADAPNLLEKEDIRDLLKALKTFGKVDMIVIDTYARAMAGGNENDAKDVGQAVAHCDVIHRKTGALVVLVHHSGKDATKGARGSGALRAAADLEIEVVQTREYRAATVTKQKDGEDGTEYQFKLIDVAIGSDEEGDAITSCVVEHSAQNAHASERKANPEGPNEKLVMRYMEAIEGPINRDELVDNTFEMLDLDPDTTKKDRRKERIKTTIKTLVRKNLLTDDGLMVSIR